MLQIRRPSWRFLGPPGVGANPDGSCYKVMLVDPVHGNLSSTPWEFRELTDAYNFGVNEALRRGFRVFKMWHYTARGMTSYFITISD